MHLFYLFSFFPLTVFSLTLWWDVRGREEYRRREKFLFFAILSMAVTGILLISVLVSPIRYPLSVECFIFQTVTVMNHVSLFFLEYSVHVRRIENSYAAGDFRKRLSYLRILLIAGIAIAAATGGIAAGTALSAFGDTLVLGLLTLTTFLLFGWIVTMFVFQIRILFYLPAGVIRLKKYPFLVLLLITAPSVLLQWVQMLAIHRILFSYVFYTALNVAFVVRTYMEYLFYRTYHLQKRIRDQEEQRAVQRDLAARIMSCSEADDVKIVRDAIRSALDEMAETVVVKDHTFKGATVFRRSGDLLRLESPDLVFGYCTPLHHVENIKRMNREQLLGLLLRQTFDCSDLPSGTDPRDSFGTAAIRTMMETRAPVRVDPIPSCYRGLHELIYLVPVSGRKEPEGFLVLYKDAFSGIFTEEERILSALTDTLSLIFQLKKGKEVQLERNRLQGEMEIARTIQTSIVPRSFAVPGYRCAASMQTACEVGGDVYDLVSSGGKNYLGIGDVAGHGLPAGMMSLIQMAAFQGAVAASEITGRELEAFEIYEIVNGILCRINRDRIGSDKFMTQNYFVEAGGRFSVAGTHLVALRYSRAADSVVEMTECAGRTAFLGLSEFISAKTSQSGFSMEAGDVLLLYTDGVIEAKNADSEQFGVERLKRIVLRMKDGSPEDLIAGITEQLTSFARAGDLRKHSGRFADDITVVVLRKE